MALLSPASQQPRSSPTPPRDPPGPPLAHPPLMLGLLVVVLVVAVVPPAGRRCDHSSGLTRGVVGTVFCAEAGERVWSLQSAALIPTPGSLGPAPRHVQRKPCPPPQEHLPFPALLATTSGRGPQEGLKEGARGQESRTGSSPVREGRASERARAEGQTQRSQRKGTHGSIKGKRAESAAKTSHLVWRERTEREGLGHSLRREKAREEG